MAQQTGGQWNGPCPFGEKMQVVVSNLAEDVRQISECVDALRKAIYGNGFAEDCKKSLSGMVSRHEEEIDKIKAMKKNVSGAFGAYVLGPLSGLLFAALFKLLGLL